MLTTSPVSKPCDTAPTVVRPPSTTLLVTLVTGKLRVNTEQLASGRVKPSTSWGWHEAVNIRGDVITTRPPVGTIPAVRKVNRSPICVPRIGGLSTSTLAAMIALNSGKSTLRINPAGLPNDKIISEGPVLAVKAGSWTGATNPYATSDGCCANGIVITLRSTVYPSTGKSASAVGSPNPVPPTKVVAETQGLSPGSRSESRRPHTSLVLDRSPLCTSGLSTEIANSNPGGNAMVSVP
mmetsp:Transcript_59565/g.137711  ORF Transcript_59565/g.137711 Transcript_59565/m.137711 type:complete len:238 (-) Transcript_59565:2217-2930(-)